MAGGLRAHAAGGWGSPYLGEVANGPSPPIPPLPVTVEDPDLPVHQVSRVEDRERLLAEALAHAEALEEQYKVVPAGPSFAGRWKTPLALVLFAAAAAVALFPPAFVVGPVPPDPTPGELDRGLRAAIYLQVQQIEAYRVREGRLPDRMEDLFATLPGLTLVRSNNRVYQLRGRRPDGTVIIYDSARPSEVFAAAATWSQEGTP